ncbi:unnamed protein product [marine sediment metagenome]|uniref:Uncharacterized protein n=1 Tax=marine sediment metagenome TaxID=412755 RepID=X1Q2J7_9ZZZZ
MTKEHTEGKGKGLDLDKGKGKGIGRGTPSPATQTEIYNKFIECFEKGWGLKTTGRVLAQIRDFSQELSAAGNLDTFASRLYHALKMVCYSLSAF